MCQFLSIHSQCLTEPLLMSSMEIILYCLILFRFLAPHALCHGTLLKIKYRDVEMQINHHNFETGDSSKVIILHIINVILFDTRLVKNRY